MLSKPLVSVVVPLYQSEATIAAALESVRAQGVAVETVVVDDGSTDRGPEIVARDFPEARLLRLARGGVSRARNAGTAATSAPYVQYLDQDDVLAEGKFAAQVAALEASGADIAYGAWRPLTLTGGRWVPGPVVDPRLGESPDEDLITHFWCPPAAYLFRRRIVERAGGWNESLLFIEDVRFLLDRILAGARFVRCEGVMAHYGVHGAQFSLKSRSGFLRSCLRNTAEVEARWKGEEGVPPETEETRRRALLCAYETVARGSFESDPETFEKAFAAIRGIDPAWLPSSPKALRLLSAAVGYRRAERAAALYRKAKKRLRHG